ncbi:hypothetical protein LMG6001_04185 [Achromobacter insolitus]|nr:hypothetical protein LMG6001_04185 [Achromobacter insolitus]
MPTGARCVAPMHGPTPVYSLEAAALNFIHRSA